MLSLCFYFLGGGGWGGRGGAYLLTRLVLWGETCFEKRCEVSGILERADAEAMELELNGRGRKKNEARQTGELINFSLIKP